MIAQARRLLLALAVLTPALLFVPALYAAWFRVRRDVAIVTTAKAELPLAIQAL